MADILFQGLTGFILLLLVGGLLALVAAYSPALREHPELGQGEGLFGPEPAASYPPDLSLSPPPVREAPRTFSAPPPDEPALAAAIALALTLYLEEGKPTGEAVKPASGGNPWALSGRWQAMQARLLAQKR